MLTTLKKSYFLGIDGGATTTVAAITDESGFTLGMGKSGCSNIHNTSIEEAMKNVQLAIQSAKEAVYRKDSSIIPEHVYFKGACVGLAGMDTEIDSQIIQSGINNLPENDKNFRSHKLILVKDGLLGLKSGTDRNWGICLVAGTGSNCYGLSKSGREATSGNWGYILGDQGSSFAMGRAILQQIMKEYDGRSEPTGLTNLVLNHLQLKSIPDLITWVYRDRIPVKQIAQITMMFDDDLLSDSIEISEIINQGVRELAQSYQAVINQVGFDSHEPLPVVLTGGLFLMRGKFNKKIKHCIKNITPNADIIIPTITSAEGACKIAQIIMNKFNIFPKTSVTFINPDLTNVDEKYY